MTQHIQTPKRNLLCYLTKPTPVHPSICSEYKKQIWQQNSKWLPIGAQHVLFFTRIQFWPSGIVVACVCPSVRPSVRPSPILSCDNSSTIQFGAKVQNNLVKIPIVLWDNWPWPSRSNWTPKSKFTPFRACPYHNLPPIWVTSSKFGTKMRLSTVQIPTNFGLDWNWSSILNF